MTTTQDTRYDATEAASILTALLTESGIDAPTVTKVRDEINHIAIQRNAALAELADALRPTDVDTLAEAIANGDRAVMQTIARALTRKDEKDYKRLVNRVSWIYDRRAHERLRKLGDHLITELLAPWMDRTIAELAPHAHVVVEHGYRSARLESDPHQPSYDEAERLTAQAHAIWRHAASLRGRGVLSDLQEQSDPRWLAFGAPHRLADESKAHREVWWLAYAVTNGAKPGVYPSYTAEAQRHAVPA
ncbi:hypothetical protein Z045_08985 [Rhodococcus pyridinivorans KG-16]|uniref:Uncharacterized protein n=1 Tax=Rhodococcus pyridinivorans KG-16 TaxID=1441730 RepID=A0A0V9UN57_9NOCA|nr:hypothetical protein [Rhodococcus pyridinivorans]KSZ59435.1 hypothetical protein Z045_08985 [Rhodococcus pyridinivorans KG-16]